MRQRKKKVKNRNEKEKKAGWTDYTRQTDRQTNRGKKVTPMLKEEARNRYTTEPKKSH